MKYADIIAGTFVSRPNRFVADVIVDGRAVRCHVKNTGRCKELLIPGAEVFLDRPGVAGRSTEYDLVAVRKGNLLINMDSQAPNAVAAESINAIIGPVDRFRREYTIGESRFDLYAERSGKKIVMEVKGVTLEDNGIVRFPDAPTERGVKHVKELTRLTGEYETHLLFIVQMRDAEYFEPNRVMHPEFADAVEAAVAAGVNVRAFCCEVNPDSISLGSEIPVHSSS